MIRRLDRTVERLAFAMAMLGGIVLVVVVLVTVASVTGRGLIFLGFGPVPGDFERSRPARPSPCSPSCRSASCAAATSRSICCWHVPARA